MLPYSLLTSYTITIPAERIKDFFLKNLIYLSLNLQGLLFSGDYDGFF